MDQRHLEYIKVVVVSSLEPCSGSKALGVYKGSIIAFTVMCLRELGNG